MCYKRSNPTIQKPSTPTATLCVLRAARPEAFSQHTATLNAQVDTDGQDKGAQGSMQGWIYTILRQKSTMSITVTAAVALLVLTGHSDTGQGS